MAGRGPPKCCRILNWFLLIVGALLGLAGAFLMGFGMNSFLQGVSYVAHQ